MVFLMYINKKHSDGELSALNNLNACCWCC